MLKVSLLVHLVLAAPHSRPAHGAHKLAQGLHQAQPNSKHQRERKADASYSVLPLSDVPLTLYAM
jgi:hypothetical protein